MWFQCVPVSFYGILKEKIRKIPVAHGLLNAQFLLAPLDFYSPRATGRVEMSSPAHALTRISLGSRFSRLA